jgi:hypothetical protein
LHEILLPSRDPKELAILKPRESTPRLRENHTVPIVAQHVHPRARRENVGYDKRLRFKIEKTVWIEEQTV